MPRNNSALDNLIRPEIHNDEFYRLIEHLARTEKINTVLEIGSSAGGGSTEAFVKGMQENPGQPVLFCMEISKARFQALKERYRANPQVRTYNVSSVPLDQFPAPERVASFYHQTPSNLNHYPLSQVLGWLQQDVEYLQGVKVPDNGIQLIKTENNISHFDMVLIDGSEFTGSAELAQIYGAGFILLDDIRTFKNYDNYQQLLADPQYTLVEENSQLRNGYAVFRRADMQQDSGTFKTPDCIEEGSTTQLPVHFFTIVLNGEPFIRYHIDVFKELPFKWHWHIIEGVADLKHDTAWAVSNGGQVPAEWHRAGRSIDGTSEYLDQLAQHYPDHITLYRQPQGRFWDGKRQMVNAPLTNIRAECLLWQVDSDELWTVDQICTARNLFLQQPERTAAFFHCHYFVGPELVTITPEAWSHHTAQEWLRVWRYRPGMRWACHEPPCLAMQVGEQWIDVARQNPFLHAETEKHGLVFTHYAYATEAQVAFKEKYYGYKGAGEQWRRLQRAQRVQRTPVNLRDYLVWVGDHAQADRVERRVIGAEVVPIPWNFDPPADRLRAGLELPVNQAVQSKSFRIVIDGVVFQKQEYRYPGISRVWRHLIPELVKALPACELIFLKRKETDIDFAGVTNYEAPAFHFGPESVLDADDARLAQICRELNADVFISTYFTRAPGVRNVLMVYDMIPEVLNGDLSHPMWQAKQRAIAAANMIITISKATKADLCRISQIPPERVTVALLGVESHFRPVDWWTVARFAERQQIKHPYFLMAGSRVEYKNSASVFRAFSLLAGNNEMQLFSFGDRHLFSYEVELAKSLNYTSAQWLPDEELPAAYAGALALVYPSVYEGFGLPVLEAMACGCPVITTRKASLPEVGGDVALYIDPGSPDELAQAMQTVLQPEVRLKLAARGVEWAANFTWQRAAATVANVLTDATSATANVKSANNKLPVQIQPFDNNLIVQAEQAKAAQNWSEASNLFMTALEQFPGVAPGALWASLGDCFTKAGNLSEAEAALLGGLEFEPDNLDILNQLAGLYLKQNRGLEFNPYLNRAFNVLDNNDVETLLAAGNLAVKVGLFDLALQIFSRLQSVVPKATKIDTVVKQLESLV